MYETTRLIKAGQTEIANHLAEAERLRAIASDFLDNAEWHCQQAEQWQNYIGGLATEHEAVVIPFQRQPEQAQLTVIQGGSEGA